MNVFASVIEYYNYLEYLQLTEQLAAAEKTTGHEPTESQIAFTQLNLQRMNRWNKTFKIDSEVAQKIATVQPQIWWVLAEAWCGDGAQNIPILQKIAEAANERIELKILLRDDNPMVMNQYLTSGGRSIPKLIAIDTNGNELFTWGPRPSPAQQIITNWKQNRETQTHEEAEKELHLWYAKDKGKTLQQELLALVTERAYPPLTAQ